MDTSPSPVPTFRDRKTGLIVFGILTILLGGICALFVPLMLFGASMSEMQTGHPTELRMILPSVITYALLAAALVWLGIGSIMLRRWARAILLLFSWVWLLVGILTIAVMAVVMPQAMASAAAASHRPMPGSAETVVIIAVLAIMGFIMVAMPVCWLLFYRSGHVKATCEAHCTEPAWTDRCPLPVLALSLMLAFSVPMMLAMPFTYRGALPFFGTFLSGPPGGAIYCIMGLVWAYAAWAIYRLDRRGWRVALATMTLFAVSAFITYSVLDVAEVYRAMGLPNEQIARIKAIPWMSGHGMAWMTLASCALMIGYTIYVGRYFPRSTAKVQP